VSEDKQFTTAIIAAVPSDNDPIHGAVDANPHVTMHFLGEAAELDDATIEQIKADIALVAQHLHPFAAELSGTAELGPDKAKVVLVQSDPLTKIREILGATPAVSTATAAVEQYPNWIPHLTLSYDEDAPDSDSFESFEVGALGLWLAGEQINFPLAKAAPGLVQDDSEDTALAAALETVGWADYALLAAGKYDFDPSLHPRGADGRFIEKFGIVKYLTPNGWGYGKVDGIYKDDAGQVQLTVTPSDLAGKPTGGAAKELTPNRVYRAPKAKAHLTTSSPGAQQIGGQGGSNLGGTYQLPTKDSMSLGTQETEKFYVKMPKSKSHGKNEALANLLYEEAGVPVPEVDYFEGDGNLYSKIVEGQQDMAAKLKDPAWTSQVQANFAVDAWLGNRDVFGMTYDNIVTDQNGVPFRIDNGGALLYRAMGESKTDFGSKVTELDAFRNGKKSAIYGSTMSKESEIDGAERVLAILPGRIEEMVAEAGLPKSLADTLKARRLYLADYYGLPLPESQKAPEAEVGSIAPLVDVADVAEHGGKLRTWFKVKVSQLAFVLQTGDKVDYDDNDATPIATFGVNPDGTAKSTVGQQSELLGMQQSLGPEASVYVRKKAGKGYPRPEDGSELAGADLAGQAWHRGDAIVDILGNAYKIKGVNDSTGAVLIEGSGGFSQLLDTQGKDATGTWTVKRWDPPSPESAPAPPVATPTELPGMSTDVTQDVEYGPQPPAAAPVKTGQAAVAETALKADLDAPLPTGSGAPAPKKTSGTPGAKKMLIGDGTEAETGAELVSKKDGKTYTFVKPKGQYAVVTDPNGEDPEKQLLKLASTMTQPGADAAVPAGEIEKPKTATGEVPALGMQALAKDGHAGEITMISPDGKFVFITDANGKKKRKSTGTVSITGGTAPVDTAPSVAPGSLKDYAVTAEAIWMMDVTGQKLGGVTADGFYDADDIPSAGSMVGVAYADGTFGLEPYVGQPEGALIQNVQGKIAVFDGIGYYQGPIVADHLTKADAAIGNDVNHTVVFQGVLYVTDGSTGPNGGLVLWDLSNPSDYAWEVPLSSQLQILDTSGGFQTLPEFSTIASAQELDNSMNLAPIIYGEEAKTLAAWFKEKNLSEGTEISLDGQNWLTVTSVGISTFGVADINGTGSWISADAPSTWVIKAPALVNGDANTTAKDDLVPEVPEQAKLPTSGPKTAISAELVAGDVLADSPSSLVKDVQINGVTVKLFTDTGPEGMVFDDTEPWNVLGNVYSEPVQLTVQTWAKDFYPGVLLTDENGKTNTVVTFAQTNDDGGYTFAVMVDGDPEHIAVVNTAADLTPGHVMGIQLAPKTTSTALGVDVFKVNEAWLAKQAPVEKPVDHNWQAAQQGLEFAKAGYPIYFHTEDSSYYRQTPTGLQGFFNDAWEPIDSGLVVEDLEKVWSGKAPTGSLLKGTAIDPAALLFSNSDLHPVPAGAAVLAITDSDGDVSLVVSPNGALTPETSTYPLFGSDADDKGGLEYDLEAWSANSNTVTVLVDPYDQAEAAGYGPKTDAPPVTQQSGPQPPNDLGAFLQTSGFEPKPGTHFEVFTNPANGSTHVFIKDPNSPGYGKLYPSGSFGVGWTHSEVMGTGNGSLSDAGWTHNYGFTYVPDAANAPQPVAGMPESYQPFFPGEGQSVLKVKLPSGKENVYLQAQPGAGWYPLETDGTTNTTSGAVKSDLLVKNTLKQGGKTGAGATYSQLWPLPDTPTDANTADVPSFDGYTPSPGDEVYVEPNDSVWVKTASDGVFHAAYGEGKLTVSGMTQAEWDADSTTKAAKKVWPEAVDTADAASSSAPEFNGYTPKPGETVLNSKSGLTTLVKLGPDDWKSVYNGQLEPYGDTDAEIQLMVENGSLIQVWPAPGAATDAPVAPAAGGVFNGYQSDPSDIVISIQHMNAAPIYAVKPGGVETPQGWAAIDSFGVPDFSVGYSNDTIEWAQTSQSYKIETVQAGKPVDSGEKAPALDDATVSPYLGVTETTSLAGKALTFGTNGYQPTLDQQKAVELLTLQPGESAYVLGGTSDTVLKRNSLGQWFFAYSDGYVSSAPVTYSDEEMQNYLGSYFSANTLEKVNIVAPTQAPTSTVNTAGPIGMSGWAAEGLPDPETMGYLSDSSKIGDAAPGTWVYAHATDAKNGLFFQLEETGNGSQTKIKTVVPVQNGEVKPPVTYDAPVSMDFSAFPNLYVSGIAGEPVPGATPGQAQAAAEASTSAPAKPSYPGAVLPSQEDVNAWGGSLTKDGFIPAPGMYVSGKGPMSGKIISVSKDKTKAVVLTSDGKKTTRLIEALKTDKTANYQAYAAPVTLKDVPADMPLAVDTPAEVMAKTIKDGKFRAILSGHPGVSQGQMVVTKATGPSGKDYSRVHLTLTPAQREKLVAMLSGSGEKGDWATSSKQSEQVAVGDELPMRKSSTDNPDGSPRWKVDSSVKPPTHTVVSVTDDPAGNGIKLVTLKDKNTGEEIVSRFHSGKSLTVYTWDPNKPKPVAYGSFALNEDAKAKGWSLVNDGGISAATGGASAAVLYNEPGTGVTKSAMGQVSSSWQTLRYKGADGAVVELIDPKGSNGASSTGVTVISLPEGMDEKDLGGALSVLGIDYAPMTQDSAKTAVRGLLRTMMELDTSDVDTAKHWSDDKLFATAGQTMGISDLGWHDVSIGVDESSGKTSFFWSQRAQTAMANKASYDLVYRAASTGSAAQIVSTVKYGSASSVLKKTTGMLDGSASVGGGASASSDNGNHAGHGSYASASKVSTLPTTNSLASYKSAGMMVYHRPEAVLGRIMDYRLANNDAFGMGLGQGSDHLKAATTMSSVRDFFLGGGLPSEAIGFIAVQDASERTKAITQLKADGFDTINGRPVEEIIILMADAKNLKPSDLPPVVPPANARPITDLPMSFDAAPAGAAA